MSHKLANNKPSQSVSSRFGLNVGDSIQTMENHRITNTTGTLIGLILLSIVCLLGAVDVSATSSSLTVSVTSGSGAFVNIPPTSEGKFGATGATTFSVTTTHASGYTLTASATNLSFKDTTPDPDIIYTIDNLALPSDTVSISSSEFESSSDYKNKWGYLPDKYYNTATNSTITGNTNYFPAPITAPQTLDITDAANPSAPNDYNIAIGVKLDHTVALGSYTTTITLNAVGNPTPYTINYIANSGTDAITNMPASPSTGGVDGETTAISTNVPIRDGHSFKGWCTVQVADDATCTGATYTLGSIYNLDQTSSSNTLTLYAMWKTDDCNPTGTTVGTGNSTDIKCMQDIGNANKATILASMTEEAQYQLTDKRDGKVYWVSKLKDGNIWMTQNLDYLIGETDSPVVTSLNTDLTSSTGLGNNTFSGYTNDGTVIAWAPDNIANTINFKIATDATVEGWNKDDNTPLSANPYGATSTDYAYIKLGDLWYKLSDCTSTGLTAAECGHYQIGVYYNFAAANATNSVPDTIGHAVTENDNYTVMPNSICPAGWRLPHGLLATAASGVASPNNSEYDTLLYAYNVTSATGAGEYQNVGFTGNGLNIISSNPLYFIRPGVINGGTELIYLKSAGLLWTNTIYSVNKSYIMDFNVSNFIAPSNTYLRNYGAAVRCLAR